MRSRTILRSKFGLKTYEEQQTDLGDYRALMDAKSKRDERDRLRYHESLWPEDKDLLGVLPPNVIRGIDAILNGHIPSRRGRRPPATHCRTDWKRLWQMSSSRILPLVLVLGRRG